MGSHVACYFIFLMVIHEVMRGAKWSRKGIGLGLMDVLEDLDYADVYMFAVAKKRRHDVETELPRGGSEEVGLR